MMDGPEVHMVAYGVPGEGVSRNYEVQSRSAGETSAIYEPHSSADVKLGTTDDTGCFIVGA